MLGLKKKSYDVGVTAQMNARLQPMHRGHFEDPLFQLLEQQQLGEVSGGGTQLADEPYGVAYCDIEIHLVDSKPTTLGVVIAELNRLGAPKGSSRLLQRMGRERGICHNRGFDQQLAIFGMAPDRRSTFVFYSERCGMDHDLQPVDQHAD